MVGELTAAHGDCLPPNPAKSKKEKLVMRASWWIRGLKKLRRRKRRREGEGRRGRGGRDGKDGEEGGTGSVSLATFRFALIKATWSSPQRTPQPSGSPTQSNDPHQIMK